MSEAPQKPHHVVIVGAGFGGLETAFRLAGAPVTITMIDRRNHHLFQPLLYQVATASLATSEIAWPIRYLLRDRGEVTTLFANVNGVDPAGKRVLLEDGGAVSYDTLVLATGARHAYFGHELRRSAPRHRCPICQDRRPRPPRAASRASGTDRRKTRSRRGRSRDAGRLAPRGAQGSLPSLSLRASCSLFLQIGMQCLYV